MPLSSTKVFQRQVFKIPLSFIAYIECKLQIFFNRQSMTGVRRSGSPGLVDFFSYLHQMIAHVWESKPCDDFSSKVLPDVFMAISNLKNELFTEWCDFLPKCAKSCVLMSRTTYQKISLRTSTLAELLHDEISFRK